MEDKWDDKRFEACEMIRHYDTTACGQLGGKSVDANLDIELPFKLSENKADDSVRACIDGGKFWVCALRVHGCGMLLVMSGQDVTARNVRGVSRTMKQLGSA
jgi:hypothetical protein